MRGRLLFRMFTGMVYFTVPRYFVMDYFWFCGFMHAAPKRRDVAYPNVFIDIAKALDFV
jgi:hypothetical protein